MTHTHDQPVGKCNGNETLEMLPHSTLQTRNSTEKTKLVPSCITTQFASSLHGTVNKRFHTSFDRDRS